MRYIIFLAVSIALSCSIVVNNENALFLLFADKSYGVCSRVEAAEAGSVPTEKNILETIKKLYSDDASEKAQYLAVSEISSIGIPALKYLLQEIEQGNRKQLRFLVEAISNIIRRANIENKDVKTINPNNEELFRRAYDVISKLASDPDVKIRLCAVYALGTLGRQDATPILEKALTDTELPIRKEAYLSLRNLGKVGYDYIQVITGAKATSVEDYIMLIRSPYMEDLGVRNRVVVRLGKIGNEAVPRLLELCSGGSTAEKCIAINILSRIKTPKAIPYLISNLNSVSEDEEDLTLYMDSIYALNSIGTAEAISGLSKGLDSSNKIIKLECARLLIMHDQSAAQVLQKLLEDENNDIKLEAASILAYNKKLMAIPALIKLLDEKKYFIRVATVLRETTGIDAGNSRSNWQKWWTANKDSFEFPAIVTEVKRIEEKPEQYTWSKVIDKSGRTKEDVCLKEDGSLSHKWTYKYREDGKTIEKARYNAANILERRIVYAYDLSCKLIREIEYNVKSDIVYSEDYTYDKQGKQICLEKRDAKGNLIYKSIYTYDDQGYLLDENIYYGDGSVKTIKHR
ncbi:MAG: HEAT repeat domain-containing protein [bacterium]